MVLFQLTHLRIQLEFSEPVLNIEGNITVTAIANSFAVPISIVSYTEEQGNMIILTLQKIEGILPASPLKLSVKLSDQIKDMAGNSLNSPILTANVTVVN